MEPFVSFISTVRNDRRIETAIESILEQDYPQDKIEIVVTDAGSTDGTLEILREYEGDLENMKVVVSEGANRSVGRNVAIQEAGAEEFIASFNSDTKFDPDWLKKAMEVIQKDPEVGSVGSLQKKPESQGLIPKLIWYIPGMSEISRINTPQIAEEGIIPTKNNPCEGLIWRREALEDVGLFPEEVNWGEDPILHYLMRREGWKVVATKDAKIEHFYKDTISGFADQQFMYGIGEGGLRKNRPEAAKDLVGGHREIAGIVLPFFLGFGALASVLSSDILYFLGTLLLAALGSLAIILKPAVRAGRKEGSFKFFLLMLSILGLKYSCNLIGYWRGLLKGS